MELNRRGRKEYRVVLLLVVILVLLALPFFFMSQRAGVRDSFEAVQRGDTYSEVQNVAAEQQWKLIGQLERTTEGVTWTDHFTADSPSPRLLSDIEARDNRFLQAYDWQDYPPLPVEKTALIYRPDKNGAMSRPVIYFYFDTEDRLSLIYVGNAS